MTAMAWPIAARHAANFVPDGDLLGKVGAQPGDELTDVARRHGLGFVELRAATSGIPATDIAAGAAIVVPARFSR